jgi:energy-coupling factor transport system ATP-binding protein
VQELIDLFGFDGEKAPFSLSRGNRQLVALASALAARPQVLILDEPTNGLDYRECMQVMRMVEDLHTTGTTVVMVSHDMEVVYDFCQRIIVMNNGRVVNSGSPDEVFRNASAMQSASIKPPQIIELAMLLGEPFVGLSTIATLRDKILEQVRQ